MSLTRITKALVFIHFRLTVSEPIVGQASKYNVYVMDIIWDELRSNNIEIDRETLSFHIDACLREYEELYGTVIIRMDKDNLCPK